MGKMKEEFMQLQQERLDSGEIDHRDFYEHYNPIEVEIPNVAPYGFKSVYLNEGDEWPDHLICIYCDERVERGIVNVSKHANECKKWPREIINFSLPTTLQAFARTISAFNIPFVERCIDCGIDISNSRYLLVCQNCRIQN